MLFPNADVKSQEYGLYIYSPAFVSMLDDPSPLVYTHTPKMQHSSRSLNWSQRVALIRHTLHAAVRSGDFTFFKSLQAQGFLEGVNYVGILSNSVGDDGDRLITALDDHNAALAQIFEDAFKTVYTKWKGLMSDTASTNVAEVRSNLYVDTSMQKQIADMAIDKTTNSIISLIEQHPTHIQETAASVWIGGVAIIADAIEICVHQMDCFHSSEDDFIRMEDSRTMVATSVTCAITALRGIYSLMDASASETNSEYSPSRPGSFSAASGVFRRLSNAFSPASPVVSRPTSYACKDGARNSSVPPDFRIGNSLRSSVSSACPSLLPDRPFEKPLFKHTELDPIPPTPAADTTNPFDEDAPEVPEIRTAFRDVVMT